ncbi:hypothetical protein N7468_010447 [Penicillium chermesinum]|uniref:AB hydrolase-1 domain-containing protein n=1 Tax=Penicillium chermesinum TaxID=63820 RepID=A0A9W9NCT4_9EURO|nr:uncharacterized protein N7468_010447 [Penicillium chermesinum]KAJ5217439.1 hypothetical protein N7468_010447 [Penicillium chermesinum]
MNSSKPTILFIPGAWHLPFVFDDTRAALAARGFPSAAVGLPAVGAEPPTKGLIDDTVAVRDEIERLSDQGKQVVVVAHSYGGMVGAGAVKGLGYAERKKRGKSGGVTMLVYMAAFVAKAGTSMSDMFGGEFPPFMKFDGDYCRAEDAEGIFYNDLSLQDRKKWSSEAVHTSRAVYEGRAAHEPWHDLPCMYIFCENDMAVPLAVQESMAGLLGEYTQFRLPSSHSPFLSMPTKLAEASDTYQNPAKMAPPVTRSRSNDPGRMTGDAGTNTPRPPTPTPGAYPDSPEEQREEVEQSTRRDERVPI